MFISATHNIENPASLIPENGPWTNGKNAWNLRQGPCRFWQWQCFFCGQVNVHQIVVLQKYRHGCFLNMGHCPWNGHLLGKMIGFLGNPFFSQTCMGKNCWFKISCSDTIWFCQICCRDSNVWMPTKYSLNYWCFIFLFLFSKEPCETPFNFCMQKWHLHFLKQRLQRVHRIMFPLR